MPKVTRSSPRRYSSLPRDLPLNTGGSESFAPIELDPKVSKHLRRVEYEGDSPLKGRLHEIQGWDKWTMERRIAFLRSFVEDTARDPAIAEKATQIVREAGVKLRDHQEEWAALLKWVQQNIRFTAEPKERIQSPQYTLTKRYGDCDDLGITLAALGYSLRLPFRFVLSGKHANGKRVRWVEGTGRVPAGVSWTHIYVQAQWPPFRPTRSAWAEPTLDVPLGWDAVSGKPPQGRADLGAPEEEEKGLLPAVKKITRELPWLTIGASVIGSVISAVVVGTIVRPAIEARQPLRAPKKMS